MKGEKELTREDMLDACRKVYGKTIAPEIEPIKYEDIPKKLAEVLSKALKRDVTISGSGLDGNDMIVDVCSEEK